MPSSTTELTKGEDESIVARFVADVGFQRFLENLRVSKDLLNQKCLSLKKAW